jgi:hypothetical protein
MMAAPGSRRRVPRRFRALLSGGMTLALIASAAVGCGGRQDPSAGAPTASGSPDQTPSATTVPSPTREPQPNSFAYGEDVPMALRTEIETGVDLGVRWLAARTGVGLDGIYVFASGSADRVVDAFIKQYGDPSLESYRKNFRTLTAFTGSGRDFYIITSSIGWTRASPIIGGPIKEGRVHTIFHELFHVVQGLVRGNRPDRVGWLHEGTAHYMAAVGLGESSIYSYKDIMNRHRPRAAMVRGNLSALASPTMTSEDGDADEYSLATVAIELLVQGKPDSGIGAIMDYWKAVGTGVEFDEAFAGAFGTSPQEFYSKFEAYKASGFKS